MTLRSARLGELCEFIGGGTPSRKVPEYWGGDIPWATVKDFCSDRISGTLEHLSAEGLKNSAANVVPSGTVLLVTRVGLGKVAISDIDLAVNQDVKALLPHEEVWPEYLFWVLKSLAPEIEAMGTGTTVKGIAIREIKGINVPLPPLDEQRRIASILNRAARIERLRARTADRLREFVPALFIKMFGDPVENPMGWRIEPLGAYCVLTQYGTSKKANDRAEGVPVLRMGNVTYDGYLNCTDLKYTELTEADTGKYALHVGDILFNRTNSKELVGKTGIWDGRFEAVAASYFIRLQIKETALCPVYVWAFMNSSAMKRRLFRTARGAVGQANINAKELKSLPLPVPPLKLQRQYTEIFEAVRNTTNIAETAAKNASALSFSLMDQILGSGA